jgi:outer membrane protein assembly factor BamE (lipoprotein component of BamABCDE complex)
MNLKNTVIIVSLIFTITACGSKIRNGGYALRSSQISELQIVKDKQQALKIAGNPSSKLEIFDTDNKDEIWMYSSYKSVQTAFLTPVYENYDLVILTFDKNGKTKNTTVKNLDTKKFIAYSSEKTEFDGEIKLGLLSELFGHIGQFSPISLPVSQ